MMRLSSTGGFLISTHAPAGGATWPHEKGHQSRGIFLLTPLREGRPKVVGTGLTLKAFLLTPLREGRRGNYTACYPSNTISTHAPAGGATPALPALSQAHCNFYSRPCGRGDPACARLRRKLVDFYSRPCGRGDAIVRNIDCPIQISTHAPAGGATAIFHKSVMRFCGKLPKDDTVLCLASFGFPRRDPKAVYLAWISCANLPQKCVRQGLALKDQGTSCFHEGLASHAFDPVLV